LRADGALVAVRGLSPYARSLFIVEWENRSK
jgi:hypothetical protein